MNNEDEIEILVSEILGSLHKPGSEDRLSAGLAEYGVWDGPGPIPLADRIVSDPRFYMSGSEDLPGPRQWLLGTELVVGEVSVLGGPAGAGKSTYVVTNLLCTASGKALLGRHVFRKYLRALYISAEDGTDETRRRVAAGCRHHGLQSTEISGLRFFGAEEVDELGLFLVVGSEESATLDETSLKKLEEIIEKWGPAIVAIDPLGSLCPGGVNRNGIMGRLIRALKKIAQRHQCAIWIVHHTKKARRPLVGGGDRGCVRDCQSCPSREPDGADDGERGEGLWPPSVACPRPLPGAHGEDKRLGALHSTRVVQVREHQSRQRYSRVPERRQRAGRGTLCSGPSRPRRARRASSMVRSHSVEGGLSNPRHGRTAVRRECRPVFGREDHAQARGDDFGERPAWGRARHGQSTRRRCVQRGASSQRAHF